ncbi:MAG: lysophospholipid acyltransferase family protein, partial [Cetobacterium sp.]
FFTKEIELVRTNSFKEDVSANTQIVMNTIEQIIKNHPNQWMWFHDRWKLYKKLNKDDIKN